jgi:uncharacterized protein (DUF2062 family)
MEILFSDASFGTILTSLSTLSVDTIIVLAVGGAVFAAPFGLASYFLSLRFFIALQKKRGTKQILD